MRNTKRRLTPTRRTTFGGRLAEYRYYDMHQVIERALKLELKP